MIRWLVSFVVVILLGGCVQEPPVIEKPDLMVIPESKYLDIDLAETSFGRPLRTRPRNPIFIGRLKKVVADTIDIDEIDDFQVEYNGQLFSLNQFAWHSRREKQLEYFVVCDKSVPISALKELVGFDGVVLNFISKCGSEYRSHLLVHGGIMDSEDIYRYEHFSRINELSVKSISLDTLTAYDELSSVLASYNSITNNSSKVSAEEECLSLESIHDSIKYWEEQRNSAVKYDIDPAFFDYELSEWHKLLAELRRTLKFEICTASESSIIHVTHDTNAKLFPILDFLSKSVQDKRRHLVEKMKFPYYNYTFNERYLYPFLYLGQWRVLSSIEDLRGCYTCVHRDLYFRKEWMLDE